MIYDNRPIGVFDSGVGGISVLRELTSIMPNENYIYFGDSLNAPYGTRPLDEVRELTFHTAGHLIGMGCKCLVIACNTATTAAVRALRARYEGVPVIGIEPALKPAVLHKPHGRVLVLATAVTLHEEKFHRLMARYENDADIFTLACPGIVEFVERGIISIIRPMPLCSDAHIILLCAKQLIRFLADTRKYLTVATEPHGKRDISLSFTICVLRRIL